jgi:hypothetical protein
MYAYLDEATQDRVIEAVRERGLAPPQWNFGFVLQNYEIRLQFFYLNQRLKNIPPLEIGGPPVAAGAEHLQ